MRHHTLLDGLANVKDIAVQCQMSKHSLASVSPLVPYFRNQF